MHPKIQATRSGLFRRLVLAASACILLVPGRLQGGMTNSTGQSMVDLTAVPFERLFTLKVESVYGASKYEQRISEAPSAVTIIDSDQIRKFGYRTLAEVLQSVRGLYVTYDRNYSYLGVRGFNRPGDYSSRVLVLVNGHRANETVFDAALIGHDFILPVDTIERVEVIRGPSSSIYGNNAFFGVVNVITKTGGDINGTEVSGWAGSFGTYSGRFTVGEKFKNDVELLISGAYYNSDGPEKLYYPEFNSPTNNINNGIARYADYEEVYKVFASISYKGLSLEGGFSSREKGVPTGAFGTIFNDTDLRTTDDRGYVELKFRHEFANDLELTARTGYDHYFYHGDYPVLYPGGARILYRDYALGNSWSSEVQLSKRIHDKHRITFGAEFRDNYQQDQGNRDNDVPRTVYDDSRSTLSYGVYGQGEVQVLKNVLFNAGLRYDNFDTFGDTANPRVALIYQPVEKTTLKLLYGTAFKAPNVYELYYAGPNNKGNTDLRPETIETYEAVIEQRLTRHFDFVASGFYYRIDDLINQQVDPADGLLVYRNLDEVTAHGIECELIGKFGDFQARLSYSYQETEDLATSRELSNSPNHLARLNVIVPLYKDKVFSGFEIQYRSSAKTLGGGEAPGFWVANLTLFSHELLPGLEVSGSIYNLFDKEYYHPAAGEHLQDKIEQDGRSFRIKATYRF